MRETIGYNKTKNGMEEFLKLKPDTNVKGKVTVQLINDKTKEVEQEIFTENIRMKWLDYQMHINAINSIGCVWDLIVKYAGEYTSYGIRFDRGGEFKNIVLVSSDEETENEKKTSIDGTVLGYCGFDTTYSGADTKQGSFNLAESNIKTDSDGNLVIHNVYDFPTHACNGTITHVGYAKNFDAKFSYYSRTIYGTDWQTFRGLPSKLLTSYSVGSDTNSWNCFHVGKNVFRFALNKGSSNNYFYICDLDIATGQVLKEVNITGYDNVPIGKTVLYSFDTRGLSISKDGNSVYMVGYTGGEDTNTKSTGAGWNLLTVSCETGKVINNVFIGRIKAGDTTNYMGEYCAALYDEVGTGNIYLFGNTSSNDRNYLQEISVTDKTVVKWTMPYVYTDADNVSSMNWWRGTLLLNSDDEIVYKRNYKSDEKKHLVFDKTALTLKRKYFDTKDRLSITMDIIGKKGLSIGPCYSSDDGNSNSRTTYTYWGVFDRRKITPVSTLTKLPSPVLKTATFTMKVQYDVIFEIPNVLEAFEENPV